MHSEETQLETALGHRLITRPLGVDDFSSVRYLHVASLSSQTTDVLSDREIAAFVAFVRSPDYADALAQEEAYGAWFDGELLGTASWQPAASNSAIARVGSVFVRHPRLGIGRRLLTTVETRARQLGFVRFSAAATANAVPFFERLGYEQASRGTKALAPHCVLPVTFLRKSLPRTPIALT